MTDNEATRTIFVRTRPALHEAEAEAEAGCYEAEAENFGIEKLLWPRELNIPAKPNFNAIWERYAAVVCKRNRVDIFCRLTTMHEHDT